MSDDGEMRLWGGRFQGGPAPELDRINRSLPLDWRLWPYELAVDRAWVDELAAAGLVSEAARDRILVGLAAVEARLESGDPGLERAHRHESRQGLRLPGVRRRRCAA